MERGAALLDCCGFPHWWCRSTSLARLSHGLNHFHMPPINADAKESPTQPITQTMIGATFFEPGSDCQSSPRSLRVRRVIIAATRTNKMIDLPTIPPLGSENRSCRSSGAACCGIESGDHDE